MKVIKYHPVSANFGFAVEKISEDKYQVAYVSVFKNDAGAIDYKKEANSRFKGKLLPFVADYVIRSEILPLYKKVA